MIIAHFFWRQIKGKDYLLCQTTCSSGDTSPWSASPEVVFEIEPGGTPAKWERRAKRSLLAAHPDYRAGDTLFNTNKRQDVHAMFDIALKRPEKGALRKAFEKLMGGRQ